MEVFLDLAFMAFGLGFFMTAMNWLRQDSNVDYQRKLNEAREFGFKGSTLQKEAQSEPQK